MNFKTIIVFLAFFMPISVMAGEAVYTIDSADGGKARLDLGIFSTINASAKLRRISWILNNSECPVELIKGAGLKPEYDSGTKFFTYIGKGEAKAKQNVQALEVIFYTFSVFDRFVGATFGVEIINFKEGTTFDLKRMGKFVTDWAEVHYFFQTVAYVSKVRLNSGEIWEQDYEEVKEQLVGLGLEPPDEAERSKLY